jgi:hypothetical protein
MLVVLTILRGGKRSSKITVFPKQNYCVCKAKHCVGIGVPARMAQDYGTILSTSVPSESVFSIAGLQITKRQNRLAPKTMGVIMCLKSWGLISEDGDGDDENEESDKEDICKDRALERMELNEVILSSQPQ